MSGIALNTYLNDFLELIYPQVCVGCGNHLHQTEKRICYDCLANLPYTNDDPQRNYLANQLMPLQPVAGVYSLCYYNTGSIMEELIHHVKYRKRKDIGEYLGRLLGDRIRPFTSDYDFILPVPLHRAKEAKRGFNQSLSIVKGIAKVMDVHWQNGVLIRQKNTSSQTKKSRTERFDNMANAFRVTDTTAVDRKKIILVDDVITTGSTIIHCAEKLFHAGASDVFLASVAKADVF